MWDILPEVVSFLAGAVIGWTLKFTIDKRKTTVASGGSVQTENVVGGDMAGRDVNR